MFKSTTTSLVLFVIALNASLYGVNAAPAPWTFRIPGVKGGVYRSGSGWGDVTELQWKQQADSAAKAASKSSGGSSGGSAIAGAAVGSLVVGGGVAGGAAAGAMGSDYPN